MNQNYMLLIRGRPNVEQDQGLPSSGLSEKLSTLLYVINFNSSQI